MKAGTRAAIPLQTRLRAAGSIGVNTAAQLAVTRAFLPMLVKGDRPRIVFVSSHMGSTAGKDGSELDYSYSASKAALNIVERNRSRGH